MYYVKYDDGDEEEFPHADIRSLVLDARRTKKNLIPTPGGGDSLSSEKNLTTPENGASFSLASSEIGAPDMTRKRQCRAILEDRISCRLFHRIHYLM